jgi:esterase, PHB depolymerase family
LLIGVLAAPQQVHTVDAVRCYRALRPAAGLVREATPGIVVGVPRPRLTSRAVTDPPLLIGRPRFGEALAQLIDLARDPDTRPSLADTLFGVWIARGFPSAALQLATWSGGRRVLSTQRYEPEPGEPPPAWLDPDRGGSVDPGLFHSVFLPAAKLIDIGLLTAPDKEGSTPMIDLGNRLSDLAELARQRRHRRPWQSFLGAAKKAIEVTDRIEAEPSHLIEIADFGPNPGDLRMLAYVPSELPVNAPLVVVLHGCTQTAHSYDDGTGWTTLADRYGFAVLLPEQRRRNNPLRCFNWFREADNSREGGEAQSIRQMVAQMETMHGIDPKRVFVTGLSAGGAMTSVMLATYPEVFAGGAVVAGVPYRSASGLQDAFEVIFQGRMMPAEDWAERVRAASDHNGPWPKVSVWHGDADGTVKPLNAEEILKQWTTVHGLASDHSDEELINGHRRRVWRDAEGRETVEAYTISGMAHGQPIMPHGDDGCGIPAPFIHDMGISSAEQIARFWGITEHRRENVTRRRPARPARPVVDVEPEIIPIDVPDRPKPATDIIVVDSRGQARDERRGAGERFRRFGDRNFGDRGARPGAGAAFGDGAASVDVHGIITKSFELAGLLKRKQDGTTETTPTGAPLGIDIPGIINTSLAAAGLFGGERATPSGGGRTGGAPGPLDIPSILSKSFEAAGLLKTVRDVTPPPPPESNDDGLADAGWEGSGWKLLPADPSVADSGPILFGHASSGLDGATGPLQRTLTCQLSLGPRPRLSYRRRLDLSAAVNMATSAAFALLVDGVAVDEVSSVGMDYREEDWTERREIDLARFANRTAMLTFELTANANVTAEVSAKAWIRDITLHDAAATAEATV